LEVGGAIILAIVIFCVIRHIKKKKMKKEIEDLQIQILPNKKYKGSSDFKNYEGSADFKKYENSADFKMYEESDDLKKE